MAYSEARKITEFSADSNEMYRFVNHGSHGFPDMESTDESILTSAHIRIQEALELVNIIDPMHSKKLNALIKS